MSVAELVYEKVKNLAPEDQQQVLDYVEYFAKTPPVRRNTRGALAHLGMSLSLEDIGQMPREAWANFPRDFPDPQQQ
jgi:hypothetical protein